MPLADEPGAAQRCSHAPRGTVRRPGRAAAQGAGHAGGRRVEQPAAPVAEQVVAQRAHGAAVTGLGCPGAHRPRVCRAPRGPT